MKELFDKHCKLIAEKYKLGNLVTGHKRSYYEEAAINALNELKKKLEAESS